MTDGGKLIMSGQLSSRESLEDDFLPPFSCFYFFRFLPSLQVAGGGSCLLQHIRFLLGKFFLVGPCT